MLTHAAFAVSLLSLVLSGIACWRAWRGERLQRGRLSIVSARAANLFEGGQSVVNLTLRNSGRDALTISAFGIEYWFGSAADDGPSTIAMMPQSYQLSAGEERLFQNRLELDAGQLQAIIDQREGLYVGVRIEYIDGIGPQVQTWAFQHVAGRADIFDKLEPMTPTPSFLQRPLHR